ncbi:MAG: dihydroorotase [SAR202 cluster bacterium]|nr:dihydroorotase [SAR202 cluster bacterium]
MTTRPILIRNVRILDVGDAFDQVGDLLLRDGHVASRGGHVSPSDAIVIDGTSLVATPGFIDFHAHLREPGFEDKETIATGAAAGARGGFTTLCAMPNTNPAIDNGTVVDFVLQRAREAGPVRVLAVGAVTIGRAGKVLTDMEELAGAGVVAFTDDGAPVADARMMRNALLYAADLGLPVVDHCEDYTLTKGTGIHDGWVASRLGLAGYPSAGEESLVARDIALAGMTGGWFHAAHLSTAGGAELVRRAKQRGLRVTAEVTPHHLTMTEEWVLGHQGRHARGPLTAAAYDTHAKVSPPLRAIDDRAAMVEALKDGTIDSIATDHAPHTWSDKTMPFDDANVGLSVLETAFGSLMALVHGGELPLETLIRKLTVGPAAMLGPRHAGLATLRPGTPADVVLFDPNEEWVVDTARFASKGKNTPLRGATLKGRVRLTIAQGQIVHDGMQPETLKKVARS